VISLAIPNRYQADSTVLVANASENRDLVGAMNRTLGRERLQSLLDSYNLYAGQPDPVQRMRTALFVRLLHTRPDESPSFQVGFVYGAPEIARRVASDPTAIMLEQQSGLSVVEASPLPRRPIYPNRLAISLTGLAV
jgi:hypothetical protein